MNYSPCSRCSGTIYGYTYVNMHPHLKIHEDCACLITPPGSPTRTPADPYGSPVLKTSHDVHPYVLGPNTLLEMLQERRREASTLGLSSTVCAKIDGDIKALGAVVEKTIGTDEQRKVACNTDIIIGIGVVNTTLESVTVALFGSRAMKYWCDVYGVECRQVTKSDYDFIVVDIDPQPTRGNIDVVNGDEDKNKKIKFDVCGHGFEVERRTLTDRAPFKVRIMRRF